MASLVTNKINLLYKNLKSIQIDRVMKQRLPDSVSILSDDEKEMLIMLLNRDLSLNPASPNCWRILNNDDGNLIIDSNLDRIKSLFFHVDTEKIDPQASAFIIKMKLVSEEICSFMGTLKLNPSLNRAIERKEKSLNQ